MSRPDPYIPRVLGSAGPFRNRLRIRVDKHEVNDDLARIRRGPDQQALLRFDAALYTAFEAAKAAVHVDTGSLKASGDARSRRTKSGGWVGEIMFGRVGSPTFGRRSKRPPSIYAKFEAGRGLGHDYMEVAAEYLRFNLGKGDVLADELSDWMNGRRP